MLIGLSSMSEIGFIVKTLVQVRSSQLIWSNWDSYIIRLLIDEIFCYFYLEFSSSLALAIGLRVQPDQDFGVLDCLVVRSLLVALLSLSEELPS